MIFTAIQTFILFAVTNDSPYAQATASHFCHMFERFGAPVMVLNLVRVSM